MIKLPSIVLVAMLSSCQEPAPDFSALSGPPSNVGREERQLYDSPASAARAAGAISKALEERDRHTFELICGPFSGPEYGGAIYELTSGGFTFTRAPMLGPEELLRRNQERFDTLSAADRIRYKPAAGLCDPTKAPCPSRSHRLVAYWHTHPNSGSYSQADREFVQWTKLPLYLTRNPKFGRKLVTEILKPSMHETGTLAPSRMLKRSGP